MNNWLNKNFNLNTPTTPNQVVDLGYMYNDKPVKIGYYEWTISGSGSGATDVPTSISVGKAGTVDVLSFYGVVKTRNNAVYKFPWVKQTVTFNGYFDNNDGNYKFIASSNNTAWMNGDTLRLWVIFVDK